MIAAATNWGEYALNHLLESLPPDFSFDAVRHASNSNSKPNPQMLLEILDELVIEPQCALMIGDTVTDMEFAKNAGVKALGVSYSGCPKELLLAYQPVACLEKLEELKTWFYL
jgi:phosphoglycolate phosphatase